jgi:hydrogenase maturation protease
LTEISGSPPRIAVLGCGNPSRGDDALGPALMERVEEWAETHPGREVVTAQDFQLQVEHTIDMAGRDLVLFVDASGDGPDPFTLRPVVPSDHASFTTHALSPEALLHTFNTLGCGDPPRAFSLGIRGHSFELGQPLSPQARENLESAWSLVRELLEGPSAGVWRQRCETNPASAYRARTAS